jgi:hypothetical protein
MIAERFRVERTLKMIMEKRSRSDDPHKHDEWSNQRSMRTLPWTRPSLGKQTDSYRVTLWNGDCIGAGRYLCCRLVQGIALTDLDHSEQSRDVVIDLAPKPSRCLQFREPSLRQ